MPLFALQVSRQNSLYIYSLLTFGKKQANKTPTGFPKIQPQPDTGNIFIGRRLTVVCGFHNGA